MARFVRVKSSVVTGAVVAIALGHLPVAPQQVPIRNLGPPSATSDTQAGSIAGLKQLPNGRVLVNDPISRRLVVLDSNLRTFAVTADSSARSGRAYPASRVGALYSYRGDSSLLIDWDSRAFLVIGTDGRVGRVMAHVRTDDLINVNYPWAITAGGDPMGRFVYRDRPTQRFDSTTSKLGPVRPFSRIADTLALLRADFDHRTIDTVGLVAIPHTEAAVYTTGASGKQEGAIRVNPLLIAPDDWAVLSDGTVAIVRAQDYHVDWVSMDGKTVSTARMPVDWRRLSDADKQARVDSVKAIIDSLATTTRPYGWTTRTRFSIDGPHADTIVPTVRFAPLDEMPDYVPPFRHGTVRADADNHIWILPTASFSARDGLLYDVVNRQGRLFMRVQLPAGRDIAGFGPGGVVYLVTTMPKTRYVLERTSIH